MAHIMKTPGIFTLVVFLGILAAACYSSPVARPTGAAEGGSPSLIVMAPAEGASLSGGDVSVSVKVESFTIKAAVGGANGPNEGHVHMKLDGGALVMAYGNIHTISGVPAGKHTLEVELVNNDHFSFSPPIKKSVTFSTETAVSTPGSSGRYGY